MSLDEERARQAAATAASAPTPLETVPEASAAPSAVPALINVDAMSTPVKKEEVIEDVGMGEMDEDDDLARALALSRGDDVDMEDAGEEDEDAEIAAASEWFLDFRRPGVRADESPTVALSMKESEENDGK